MNINYKKQKGIAFLLSIVALLAIISTVLIGYQQYVSNITSGNTFEKKQEYINRSSENIKEWYSNNAWYIDSNPAALTSTDIFTRTNLVQQHGITIESSVRLNKDGIYYHVFVIWLPNPDVTGTSFDSATGIFTTGSPAEELNYAIISGYPIEVTNVSTTNNKVKQVANLLENWFDARKTTSSMYEIDENWFRTPSCVAPDARYLACYDILTDIDSILTSQGISSTVGFKNAWGRPIYATNATPFQVDLETNAPWGMVSSGLAKAD